MDVIGDVQNCLSLARSLFVDEIFFSVPADKKLVISMVEEARAAGIDVRVVPDLYDGLAWNAHGGVYRPVSDDSAAPPRVSDWGVSAEADAGHYVVVAGAAGGWRL